MRRGYTPQMATKGSGRRRGPRLTDDWSLRSADELRTAIKSSQGVAGLVARDVADHGAEAAERWLDVLERFSVFAAGGAGGRAARDLLLIADALFIVRAAMGSELVKQMLRRSVTSIKRSAEIARLRAAERERRKHLSDSDLEQDVARLPHNQWGSTRESFGERLQQTVRQCFNLFKSRSRPPSARQRDADLDSLVGLLAGVLFSPATAAAGIELPHTRGQVVGSPATVGPDGRISVRVEGKLHPLLRAYFERVDVYAEIRNVSKAETHCEELAILALRATGLPAKSARNHVISAAAMRATSTAKPGRR